MISQLTGKGLNLMGTRTRVPQRLGAPFSVAAIAAFLSVTGYAMAAGTAAGTAITNTATANYSDGTNNYSSQSNTVSTTVQPISSETVYLSSSVPTNTGAGFTTVNAPASTATANGTIVTSNNTVTDSYILTNNGNTTAKFAITSAGFGVGGNKNESAAGLSTTNPAADTSAITPVYTAYNCASGQTVAACAVAANSIAANGSTGVLTTYTTEASLASAVGNATVATNGGYIYLTFAYNTGSGFTSGTTNSTVPDGTVAVGTVGAGGLQVPTGVTATATSTGGTATTANAATFSDQVLSDARLDVLKTTTTPSAASDTIKFTITGNNGGSYKATPIDMSGVIGSGPCGTSPNLCNGFAISDVIQANSNGAFAKIYNGFTGEPAGTASVASSCPASAPTATVFYNTSATPALATGWAKVVAATNIQTARLLVLICSSSGTASLPAANGNSTGYGQNGFNNASSTPTVTTAQMSMTFYESQAGTLAASATQPNNADSIIGDNNGAGQRLIGPGVNSGTTPSAANENTMLQSIAATPTSSTGTAASSGYAKPTSTTEVYLVIGNGPTGQPDATGDFYPATRTVAQSWTDATQTPSTSHDFSVGVLLGTGTTAITGGVGASPTVAYNAQNGSSLTYGANTVNIVHTLKNEGTGTDTFQLSVDTATYAAANISGAAAGSGAYTPTYFDANCTSNVNVSAAGLTSTVAAGASLSYCIKYTPSGTINAGDQKVTNIVATSQAQNTITGNTYDLLIAGDVIQLVKSVVVGGNSVPGGTACTTTANLLPGCTLTYTVTWYNLAPSPTANGSVGNVSPSVTNFTIAEDGNAGTNTWYNAASPTTSATTGITTAGTITGDGSGAFTYYGGAIPARGGTCYPTTNAASGGTTCNAANSQGASGAAISGTYQGLLYVYGNSTAAAVTYGTTGSISFTLTVRST